MAFLRDELPRIARAAVAAVVFLIASEEGLRVAAPAKASSQLPSSNPAVKNQGRIGNATVSGNHHCGSAGQEPTYVDNGVGGTIETLNVTNNYSIAPDKDGTFKSCDATSQRPPQKPVEKKR